MSKTFYDFELDFTRDYLCFRGGRNRAIQYYLNVKFFYHMSSLVSVESYKNRCHFIIAYTFTQCPRNLPLSSEKYCISLRLPSR
jgi:hypothetical protein